MNNIKNILFLALLLIAGLSSAATDLLLKGQIEGTEKGNAIRIYGYRGLTSYLLDSIELKKGKFEYDFSSVGRGLYNVGFSQEESIPVVIDNGVVELTGTKQAFKSNAIITGSPGTETIKAYWVENDTYDKATGKINSEYQQLMKLKAIQPAAFEQGMLKIRQTWDSLQKVHNGFFVQLRDEAKDPYSKELGALFAIDDSTTKETFLNQQDFQTDLWTKGDMIQRKVNTYLTQFVPLQKTNVRQEMNGILALAQDQNLARELVSVTLISISAGIDQAYSKELWKAGMKDFPDSKELEKLGAYFPPDVGDPAPEISLKNPDGEIMKLSELRGKVVLLDFWASWCGPCIRESPNVVAAYKKYQDKGFTVYGVSLDGDANRWKGAITKYDLIWPNHVSDLKRWKSEASRRYGVSGIPATFLINEEGIIIAKNLRGQNLHSTLDQLLGSK